MSLVVADSLLAKRGNVSGGARECESSRVVVEGQNVRPRQAPFARHRCQVGDVGYGPQRMFINSWRDVWWKIRCGRLGDLAQASLDDVVDE